MAKSNCTKCAFKAKYDNNPQSFLGRVWRWHINFCPGWKGYMNSLDKDERNQIAEKYNMKKFML
jgi:hypothetical protein